MHPYGCSKKRLLGADGEDLVFYDRDAQQSQWYATAAN